jgi:acetyl esterase/lipase
MRSLRQRLVKRSLKWFLLGVRRGLSRDPTPARIRRDMSRFDRRMLGRVPHRSSAPVSVGDCEGVWVDAAEGDTERVVLYLHGGAFVGESPHTHRALLAKLCRRAGARGFYLSYRLAPEHPYPAASDDCLAAYRFLLGHGVDPRHLVVAGDSAGGNLTIGTAMRVRDLGLPLPAALVVMSPALDATFSGDSMRRNDGLDPLFRRATLARLAGTYVGPERCLEPYVSPLFGDPEGLPPTLAMVGSSELLLDDTVRYATRARGVTVQVWHDMPHVWPAMHGLAEAEEASVVMAEFIVRHTPEDTAAITSVAPQAR